MDLLSRINNRNDTNLPKINIVSSLSPDKKKSVLVKNKRDTVFMTTSPLLRLEKSRDKKYRGTAV